MECQNSEPRFCLVWILRCHGEEMKILINTVHHKLKYHPYHLDMHSTTVRFCRNFLPCATELWNGLRQFVVVECFRLWRFLLGQILWICVGNMLFFQHARTLYTFENIVDILCVRRILGWEIVCASAIILRIRKEPAAIIKHKYRLMKQKWVVAEAEEELGWP